MQKEDNYKISEHLFFEKITSKSTKLSGEDNSAQQKQ